MGFVVIYCLGLECVGVGDGNIVSYGFFCLECFRIFIFRDLDLLGLGGVWEFVFLNNFLGGVDVVVLRGVIWILLC